ncbi:glycosyltransferase family 4 protein [Intrasporangium calvum]|uniref:Glycosyltransferase family 4 protein n=1 Tax=Intrasporangium calvum TaxID=53358 RepID=A0ABT5GHI1_9MICO|nr:glycosyltransferase family 4 protein [Intrasporangium calvum]MDC5697684.1 glycosyltransferase family 4 protein [Intrasporangium calvum]
MRIVHAVCTDAFAGVERHIAVLAMAQADSGHDVIVVGGHARTMREVMDRRDIRHVAASTVWDVRRALDRLGDADVFNVHMTSAEIAAALAFRSRQVPVVATRHFPARRGASSWLAGVAARMAARRISAQIAVSRFVADHIEPPSTVVVSGVPMADGAGGPARRSDRVLVAQRLEPEKRTADALRIFALAGLAADGWSLDIAGEGRERHLLEGLADELGIGPAVRFLGHRNDVADLMDRSAILLAAGCNEALGLTVLEAMSRGLPVVAAAGGGHVETVCSVAPEWCHPVGDLRKAADLLAALARDPAPRIALGDRLRSAQRSRFTVAAQAEATEAVYRSVL